MFDVIALQRKDEIGEVKKLVNKSLKRKYGYDYELSSQDIQIVSFNLFGSMVSYAKDSGYNFERLSSAESFIAGTFLESKDFSEFALYRRRWTEDFIRKAVRSIEILWDEKSPAHSTVRVGTAYRIYIEFLKAFNYVTAIRTKKLRLNDQRSKNIIYWLFHAFMKQPFEKGAQELALFPYEIRAQYEAIDFSKPYKGLTASELKKWNSPVEKHALSRLDVELKEEKLTNGILSQRMRFVCDYISSLTDDEALQLYRKLNSTERVSVFGFGF